ncbi:HNH endonuclease signature motif containing protein [Nesterenkonia alkaliphila]|uniref:HNH nuclease domain-containing protein n=1 Tax=Nesterenkonia alkaliphila TaxID=1463631 RepID=A0A7K1UET3_9MICC|nr:HNH endonuclease signature motif containing protein [Nesterenkonia alkaliphila]MVT24985.1 hypothetical protein [Nesterenkonia alkaliphila]GFZ87076.1 hypothetical protein GCM10011359_15380 [Nesterenkonia alkaliphila]
MTSNTVSATPAAPTDKSAPAVSAEPVTAPVLPEAYEDLAGQPELAAAWEAEVAARRAEAVKLQALLEYQERRLAEEDTERPFAKESLLKRIRRDAALMLGVPEAEVRRLLSAAATALDWVPRTWELYRDGQIDFTRLAKVASGASALVETNSGHQELQKQLTCALDQSAAAAAPQENVNTLGRIVRDTVNHLDAEGHQRRCERARGLRSVTVTHHDYGMSTLRAYLPTEVIAPLEEDLHTAAKSMSRRPKPTPALQDDETPPAGLDQAGSADADAAGPEPAGAAYGNRMADALAAWLSDAAAAQSSSAARAVQPPSTAAAEGARSTVPPRAGATINITVPLDTVTGTGDAPAVSVDGRFSIPASQVRAMASDSDAQHCYYLTGTETKGEDESPRVVRIVKAGKTNPVAAAIRKLGTGSAERAEPELLHQQLVEQIMAGTNLLENRSGARFVTGRLREGILLRDGQCQAVGCTAPGYASEIDHKTSFESGGSTDAANSWVLCRTHHDLKGRGLLPEAGNSSGTATGSGSPEPDPPGSSSRGQRRPPQRARLPDFDSAPPPAWASGGEP